jgi:hypothetical protein
MYGHLFYKSSNEEQVDFINRELANGSYATLDELAESIFVDISEMKEELLLGGFVYIQELNRVVRFLENVD